MRIFPLRILLRLFIAWILPVAAFAEEKFAWEPKEIEGGEYVSVAKTSGFYGLEEPKREGKEITLESKLVKVVFEIGSSTCVMNGVKFIFDKPVRELDAVAYVWREDLSLVLDPVLRPNYIETAMQFETVILDPAHGGKDRGAVSGLGTAAGYSLKVAQLAAKLLEGRGYEVVMTRGDDVDVPQQQRLDRINAVEGKAIFISIDFSSGPEDKRGIETMPLAFGKKEAAKDGAVVFGHGSASMALATAVHGGGMGMLAKHTGDLGVRRTRDSLFSTIKFPAIEFKGGYLSHELEARLIHNDAYQRALAKGIADGVGKYRSFIQRKPLKQ